MKRDIILSGHVGTPTSSLCDLGSELDPLGLLLAGVAHDEHVRADTWQRLVHVSIQARLQVALPSRQDPEPVGVQVDRLPMQSRAQQNG